MKLIYSYETYLWISLVWMSIGVITFFYLFFKTAPYGRHTREGWGPMIDNKLGWFIMEFTVLIVLYCYFIPIGFRLSLPSWIMVGLFTFHYLNLSLIHI